MRQSGRLTACANARLPAARISDGVVEKLNCAQNGKRSRHQTKNGDAPGARKERHLRLRKGQVLRLKRPRNQQFHDFVGAAINTLHPRVGIHAADRIFIHVAIAAVQLQALVNDLVFEIGQ